MLVTSRVCNAGDSLSPQDDIPFHHIFQFADISRPVVLLEMLDQLQCGRWRLRSEALPVDLPKMVGELGHILSAIPQRRQAQSYNAQKGEKVFTEPPRCNLLLPITAARTDNPKRH